MLGTCILNNGHIFLIKLDPCSVVQSLPLPIVFHHYEVFSVYSKQLIKVLLLQLELKLLAESNQVADNALWFSFHCFKPQKSWKSWGHRYFHTLSIFAGVISCQATSTFLIVDVVGVPKLAQGYLGVDFGCLNCLPKCTMKIAFFFKVAITLLSTGCRREVVFWGGYSLHIWKEIDLLGWMDQGIIQNEENLEDNVFLMAIPFHF